MKKTKLIIGVVLVATITAFVGCKQLGENPTGPSKFERAMFDTVTNYVQVPVKVPVTNYVDVPQVKMIYETNLVDHTARESWVTNFVSIPKYDLITVTQQVEQYTHATKESVKQDVGTVGGIVNTFLPGIGTAISGALLGLLGAWGKIRSSKKTGAVLAQNIEAMREFLITLPNGEKYDEAIVQYLKDHQNEADVAKNVAALLEKYVNVPEAVGSATEIKNAVTALSK